MGCVIPFYMLFAHKGYISMYHFFRQRFGYGPMKSFVHVYLNHYAFGKVILDRFAVYSGRKFQIEIEGYEAFHGTGIEDRRICATQFARGQLRVGGLLAHHRQEEIQCAGVFGRDRDGDENRGEGAVAQQDSDDTSEI